MSPPRVALITGATGGLGLQVAKNLARKGFHVVLVGREGEGEARRLTKAKEQVGSAASSIIPCDFSSLEDVRRAAAVAVEKHPKLDFALLNAAVWPSSATTAPTRTATAPTLGAEQALVVNHLSQFLLARLLLPALRRADPGARCVFVSSELHRNTSPLPPTPGALFEAAAVAGGGAAAAPPLTPRSIYASTKLLNIWSARELQRREPESSNVRFAAVSPGFVPSTGLSRNATAGSGLGAWAFRTLAPWLPFAVSLDEGARRLESALLLGDPAAEQKGGAAVYYTKGAAADPSSAAMDDSAAQEAWRLTEERLGPALLAPLR